MRGEIYPIQPFFVNNTTKYYKKMVPCSPYIHFYSFTVDGADTAFSAAIPDGCADMLFVFHEGRAEGYLYGFVTKSDDLRLQRGARCFGVRFRAGYLPERLGVSLPELVNSRVSLGDLPDCGCLIEKLAKTSDFLACVKLLRNFIGERWRSHPLLQQLIDLVWDQGGAARMLELEEQTLYSARYINRVFNDNLGLSPKAFSRCARFQRLLGMMNSAGRSRLSDLAMEFGYFDQAHLSKEFKELAGITPKEYFNTIDVEHYNQKLIYL